MKKQTKRNYSGKLAAKFEKIETPEEKAKEERDRLMYDRYGCCENWRTQIAVVEKDEEYQCEVLVIKRARVERIEEYGSKVLAFVALEDDGTRQSVEWPRFGAPVEHMEKHARELKVKLEWAKSKIAEAEDRIKRGWSTNSCGILQSTATDIEIESALYCAAVDRVLRRTI